MTETSTPLEPVGAAPKSRRRAKAPDRGDGNPASAGAFTKTTLIIICFLWLVPTIGVLITSFRNRDDANRNGWWTFLTDPGSFGGLTAVNYKNAIEGADLGRAFINSFAIALPATFIPILIAAFAAYAFTFMEFRGRDVLFISVVGLLVIPNYVALVPMLKIYGDTGLAGKFPSVWLAHIGFGMSLAIYILRNYMATLPKSVIESAKIDGASHYQTFYKLILPMSVPALASFAIFQFLWVWNDLLVALVFIGPGENEPITVATTHLLGQQGQGWEKVTAGGLFSMVVPIAVFLSLQRYFIRGMTSGAVKG